MDDKGFMRLAIKKARQGIAKGQTPFGACIVKKGKVIACSHNVVWKNKDITAHAEITAIRAACKKLKSIDLSGCTIYSTTEPCPMCFSAIHWARIPRIFFGARIEDAKKAGFHEMEINDKKMMRLAGDNLDILGGFLRDENIALFREWKRKKGRPY